MKEQFLNSLYLLGIIIIFATAVMIAVSILEHLGIIELPNDKNE